MLIALAFLTVAVFMFLNMSKRATPAVAFMPSAARPPIPVPATAVWPNPRTAAGSGLRGYHLRQ